MFAAGAREAAGALPSPHAPRSAQGPSRRARARRRCSLRRRFSKFRITPSARLSHLRSLAAQHVETIARTVVLVAVHPEGEDGLREELLLEHVLERRRHAVDGDGLVGHAEDAVELRLGVREWKAGAECGARVR